MGRLRSFFNCIAAAFLMAVAYSHPVGAQSSEIDLLFEQLAKPDQQGWQSIEESIWREWSKSGSPAMDLLLSRGRAAMTAGDTETAINHFTALIDHAPGFAEGWNARATAFYQAELYGPSVQDIRQALSLNPRHFGAFSGLGIILEELGYDDRALAAYRAVQAIHPHRPNVEEAIDRLVLKVSGPET
ncbi:MAG: tetratricopeptide (TPR) repeat protein [Paracoccaceae bacterium]|jgi:tetratricopeptide (TPR) repeat protein